MKTPYLTRPCHAVPCLTAPSLAFPRPTPSHPAAPRHALHHLALTTKFFDGRLHEWMTFLMTVMAQSFQVRWMVRPVFAEFKNVVTMAFKKIERLLAAPIPHLAKPILARPNLARPYLGSPLPYWCEGIIPHQGISLHKGHSMLFVHPLPESINHTCLVHVDILHMFPLTSLRRVKAYH